MPITQVGELPYPLFLRYRRDSFIYHASRTEEGRRYLDEAWLFEQDEPDKDAARALFGS